MFESVDKLYRKKPPAQKAAEDDSASHLTILHPRDSWAASEMVTDMGDVMKHADRENFANRRQFFFATLAFCLGLGNIWRFPRQVLLYGDATYIYIYVFFCFTMGVGILFFEVALGQYSSKGFMKVFAMCPLFEGISYAMTMYCTVANIFYNMVNVYNVRYISTVFASPMAHDCNNVTVCRSPDLPQSLSSEYIYFANLNEHGVFSWRNALVILALWVLIFIGVITGITKLFWIPMSVVIFVVVALVFTCLASCTVSGIGQGLETLFVPKTYLLKNLDTWVLPFQQCLITLGLGMGPIINFGAYSRFKSLAHIDCVIIIIIAVICSILAAMILFSSAGAIAQERHKSIQDALWTENRMEDFQVHIIFTQLCNRLTNGFGNFTLFMFYLALMLTSFFTAIELTSAMLALIENVIILDKARRMKFTAIICAGSFVFGIGMIGGLGQKLMAATDTVFISPSQFVIIICEMIAVIYIYGMTNYCDDIEFMLGFVPSYFFQVQWLVQPMFLTVLLALSLYIILKRSLHFQDMMMFTFVFALIVLPVILKAIRNCAATCKTHQPLITVLHPREVVTHSDESTTSHHFHIFAMNDGKGSSTHKSKATTATAMVKETTTQSEPSSASARPPSAHEKPPNTGAKPFRFFFQREE